MSLFAQHGWGKGEKISKGIIDGSLAGVIWSPRDEEPGTFNRTIGEHKALNENVIMITDPEFYVAAIPGATRSGNLPQYPYFPRAMLTRPDLSNPSNIDLYVQNTIDYQLTLGVDRIVSPTICFDDFLGRDSQVAQTMAYSSINYHSDIEGAPPLLISLVISANALNNRDGMNNFLDDISVLNAEGFYIIVRRGTVQYPSSLEPGQLENLLYLVYALSVINQFEVLCGYTDFEGLLMGAAGADVGCGWYSNLRQFSYDRFLPTNGGRAPNPRYTSNKLLNSILVSELDTIHSRGLLNEVLSGTPYDEAFVLGSPPSGAVWPQDISALHHWYALSQTLLFVENGTIQERLEISNSLIAEAEALYVRLERAGVLFGPYSGSRNLRQWRIALDDFRSRCNL